MYVQAETEIKNIIADSNANVPLEEFDWSDYCGNNVKKEEISALYNEHLTNINEHELLLGRITKILDKEIVVDINFKYEGLIPLSEFRDHLNIKVGDRIYVMVEKREYKGQLILSHRKANILLAWKRAKEAYNKKEIIPGKIIGRTKGGLIVKILTHIEAFMPGSQISHNPLSDFDAFFTDSYNKTMELKIIKINEKLKNVVVSHKALIEEDIEKQKKEFLADLKPGKVVLATVKNITNYGAFCDLGGINGLIHHTDISWKRINHPSEVLKVNQEIKVVILNFNEEKNRIQLGMKQIVSHPWNSLNENIKVGDRVKGQIKAITEYGAFVEIENFTGIEALLHVSEMSWDNRLRLRRAKDLVKIDDTVECVILTLDRNERKMSLGMKQLTPDPWIYIQKKYSVGSKHTRIIRSFTNSGVSVYLEKDIEGMVYKSDLSWYKKIKHASELFKIGDSIETVVLELNKNKKRIIMGHKQINKNPWEYYEKKYIVGSIHPGKVIDLLEKGATVQLEDKNVKAFMPLRVLEQETVKKYKKIYCKIIEFHNKLRKIVISPISLSKEEEKKHIKKITKKQHVDKLTLLGELSQFKNKNDFRTT
ncbi:30S ribosomal protein S1 [Candidatus Walczuchella endosymbiont of Icerya purchasi]|uniref:30S ribosomal protein S1 n=1 Tax=Candidatus Walczuchella endosymbiont of Icerya purchasi TaxID=3066219 RepID=UPI00313D3F22